MASKLQDDPPRFFKCDDNEMVGTVSMVHDEEYSRRRVTVRLNPDQARSPAGRFAGLRT